MSAKRIWTLAAAAVTLFICYKLITARSERAWPSSARSDEFEVVQGGVARSRRWRLTFPAFLRLAFWSGVIAGILLLSGLVGLSGTTTAGTSATATFTATEDTFLKDSRADRVYGQYVTLQADNYPSVKRILLRFHVAGIPETASLISATLRVFVVEASSESGEVHAVGGRWSEAITRWSNAPAVGVKIADLTDPAMVGTWREADVTSAVTGNGDVDFYIVTPSANGVDCQSTEGGPNPPTLVVQWSAAPSPTASTPTPTSTPRVTPTFTPTATSMPSPTSTPADPSFQPQPPITGAFFYPWFPNAWDQAGIYPYTNYTPLLGLYDSRDDAVIDQQLRLAASAHLEAFISSWWGQGHHTDMAFEHILGRSERPDSPYRNLRWAIYYEGESQGDPAVSQIVSDLQYLANNYFQHSGYLKVNGSPVVFVYADAADACGMADRWVQAKTQFGGNVYIVLKVFSGYKNCASQPGSWHQYAPAVAYDSQSPYSVTVSPGFWKVGEQPRLVRDSARFESDVQRMAGSSAFWQLVTAWNEWGEGTSVEAATEFGSTYLDTLCRNLPGSTACSSGPTPTPTPSTPTPTLTPTPTPTGGEFTFTASGDHGATGATTASLDMIAASGARFHLALGDMSYDDIVPESGWCDYLKSHLGQTFPFEVVVGNHEEDSRVDGFIRNFAACLPDRMGSVGDYSTEYYFDVNGLARFILIGAGHRVDGVSYDYPVGSPRYNWLASRISEAKQAGMWVIVGMHKACITAGNKPCEIGADLYNLLLDNRVDLILQAHDHDYQRFKQLTCAQVGAYAASCVADDGADGCYVRGAGAVTVITGTIGGGGLTSINTGDPEYGYVANWMGSNSPNAGRGFMKYTVSPTQIRAQFVGSTTSFSDSFAIGQSCP